MNKNVRTINEIDLYEISLVMHPANPYCTVILIDGGDSEVHSDSEVV